MTNQKKSITCTDFESIKSSLWKILPDIAREIIDEYLDLSIEQNRTFLENPDSIYEHEINWHQWGIITHSQRFLEYHISRVPIFLKHWNINKKIKTLLCEKIDSLTKEQLFEISIIFHDLGKFSHRKIMERKDGSTYFSFKEHQDGSGIIIRKNKFKIKLKKIYPFSEKQIEYIAKCAELHYELGVLRNAAKKFKSGYSKEFLNSSLFNDECLKIIKKHPDFALEVGLLFLGDSLAKTEIHIPKYSDDSYFDKKGKEELIQEIITEKGLNKKIRNAVFQMVINIDASQRFLEMYLN